jgi:hypothetical protein
VAVALVALVYKIGVFQTTAPESGSPPMTEPRGKPHDQPEERAPKEEKEERITWGPRERIKWGPVADSPAGSILDIGGVGEEEEQRGDWRPGKKGGVEDC